MVRRRTLNQLDLNHLEEILKNETREELMISHDNWVNAKSMED
jgi:hypothetical protein